MSNNRAKEIQKIIKDREIEYLLHFTRIENVDSILKNGLIPRARVGEVPSETCYVNDEYRYDNAEDANCLSISFPNYKMFYTARGGNSSGEGWIILVFDAKILVERDCAFCYTNAASKKITSINLENRKSADAFRCMFYDTDGGDNIREQLNIPDCCTTDPQAEVLLFDIIEPSEIISVLTYSEAEREGLSTKYPEIDIQSFPLIFGPRKDHTFW